jgi:Flp pilus assembly protein TadG
MFHRKQPSGSEDGQILVIVAAGMVVLIALVGLVIDGGFAWGRQRDTQNAADAASLAGATVLAERLAGAEPEPTDADVNAAVNLAFTNNEVPRDAAFYTNLSGQMLNSGGNATTNESAAVEVGDGVIPPNAAGVLARGSQTFDTFLMRVVGINESTTTAPATAIAGYLEEVCAASSGCDVIPITFPVTILQCDNTGNSPVALEPPTFWQVTNDPISIPMCGNGPGNVGWIDWFPGEAGCDGTPSEGLPEVECEILTPNNPPISLPSWHQISQTGNPNAAYIEAALNSRYTGAIVRIPQFDGTCGDTPTGTSLGGCDPADVGGGGTNQWYHLPQFASFQFCGPDIPECVAAGATQGAYINGSNPICATLDYATSGTTSCLVGRFVKFVTEGTVGPGTGSGSSTDAIGVQLIN